MSPQDVMARAVEQLEQRDISIPRRDELVSAWSQALQLSGGEPDMTALEFIIAARCIKRSPPRYWTDEWPPRPWTHWPVSGRPIERHGRRAPPPERFAS